MSPQASRPTLTRPRLIGSLLPILALTLLGLLALAVVFSPDTAAQQTSTGAQPAPASVLGLAPSGTTTVTLALSAGAWIDEGHPDLTPGGDFSVGKVHGGDILYQHWTLLKFDLAGLPSGATVQSATLRVFKISGNNEDPTSVAKAPCTSAWNAASVTWARRPSLGTVMRPTNIAHAPRMQWHSLDVKAIAQYWVAGNTNHGLALFVTNGMGSELLLGRTGAG